MNTYTDRQGREHEDPERDSMRTTPEDRRWSNTYLHVDLIEDPKARLRSLRTMLAGDIAQHLTLRNLAAKADIDWRANRDGWTMARTSSYAHIATEHRAILHSLRRVAKELR